MPTSVINEILSFCPQGTIASGDIMALEDYKNDVQRLRGHQPGIARRELENMALRQSSFVAAGLAQFVAKRYAPGVRDDADLDALETAITAAITALISASNAQTATRLATKRTIGGVAFDGSANIHHYATCSTAAATAAKTVALAGFALATGARVLVKFTVTNSAANPGDVVLDPFCGCGTAIHAAQKLGRKWIGIDITHLAISLITQRIRKAFPDCAFQVSGTPRDVDSARYLAESSGLEGRYQFQYWALSLIDALPAQDKKKGADGGLDGFIWAYDGPNAKKPFKIAVSVKSGKIPANHIRELAGLLNTSKDNTQMAFLLTLEEPSRKMRTDALAAGHYEYPNGKRFQRIQILTIRELLAGAKPDYLDYGEGRAMNKQAKREVKPGPKQASLI